MSRNRSFISRDFDATETGREEPSWFQDYVNNLEKSAVKSKKDDYALFDQINSILGNKSKYSSVEEAVLDMQKRTGLYDLINKKEASSNILKDIPEIKIFVDNYVEDRPGTSVDSVVHDMLKIKEIKDKLPQSDDVPMEVKIYINEKILEHNADKNSGTENLQLGKVDVSNNEDLYLDNDPFKNCTPATK